MRNLQSGKTAKPKTLGKGNRFEDVDLILRCALDCYRRYGVEKTRMEDIARLAGISRPLLYKLFRDRQALNDSAINCELKRLCLRQKKYMQRYSSFREILIEGLIAGIELARADNVLIDLLVHGSAEHLPTLLLDRSQPAHKQTLDLWKPFFDKARENGELARSINDDDLMEWIMGIQHSYLMREDFNPIRIRELLEVFLCPALRPIDRKRK